MSWSMKHHKALILTGNVLMKVTRLVLPLAIANVAMATDSLISYLSILSQCQFINISLLKHLCYMVTAANI